MLFSPKTSGKIILLLEIQSSVARSSLVWYRIGEPIRILFVDERPIPFKPNVGTPYFIKTTLKALSQTIDAAMKDLHAQSHADAEGLMPHTVEEIHYVLSSPWIASQARTLSLALDKNTAITDKKVREILDEERKKLMPDTDGPLETIEEKIFDVRLNGYSVLVWENKQAHLLEISYAVTVGGSDTIRRFRESCEHIIRPSRIHFHSSLLLQYVGVLAAMPERTTYTLVHIHGELTDVLSVKNGSCTFFGSYPMGINTIIRKIAHSTKMDIQTADSLISLYLGNRLDPEHASSTASVMKAMAAGWSGELSKLFKDTSLQSSLGRDVLVAARSHEDFFVQSLATVHPGGRIEAWSPSEAMPNVIFASAAHHWRIISSYSIAIRKLAEGRL
ncbi:MAG: hypothetical protein JWO00_646 [Candidatus Parcubacteria bacterium]|nr:hypothetical protein [Candidatus Parcubacteria bacterium]